MVRIFSVYHFGGQMVDTVDDMLSLTVTNHNKILIAREDYSVQVKDLFSDQKSSLFSFPTVDKVQKITHCACGNYVATLEGRQTFQKSDRLIVRIYTNWEAQFVINESMKSSSFGKRLLRARIAGIVSPSVGNFDDDYLEMIEIPISFTSPAFLTVCQKTGNLLVTCGQTMHLFKQVYPRGHNSKTPSFMDFVPFTEVFQLSFHPTSVSICENVLVAHSSTSISVFALKKVTEKDGKLYDISGVNLQPSESYTEDKFTRLGKVNDAALDLSSLLKLVQGNNRDYLSKVIHPNSFPVMVSLKGINDAFISKTEKRFPFKILDTNRNYEYRNGKVLDNLVETLCDKDISVVAESLLALRMNDAEETVTKIALQVLSHRLSKVKKFDSKNEDLFCVGSEQFIGMNLLVTTYQEGYLFYMSSENLKEGPQCVAVFNFMSPVISVMFDSCFLHVLTETGLETYTVPSLHSVILHEKPDVTKFSQYISIIGAHPFMGIVDFIGSKDLIIIFTSAAGKRTGRESLPWTVYSLKLPDIFEVYQEMIENSNSFKSRDDEAYKYLSLESFLVLQTALKLHLPLQEELDKIIRATHSTNSEELAKIYFRSGNEDDMRIGCSVILTSQIDPFKFVKSLGDDKMHAAGIVCLMKKWISSNSSSLNEENVEWLIKLLDESKEYDSLTLFILSNKHVVLSSGRKFIPCLKKYVFSESELDVQAVYALSMLCAQECYPKDALDALLLIKDKNKKYRKSFMNVALTYWTFLFDEISNNGKKQLNFSELSSLLIENLPSEMAEILAELALTENSLEISDIAQMLMKQFPCHVSMQKGHFVLRYFLELIFCSEALTLSDGSKMDNCLMVLVRSYLTELLAKGTKETQIPQDYEPIFVLKLPDFIYLLPEVENINYLALRRLQELIWSKKLSEVLVKEVIGMIQDVKLKLNLMALSNSSDFVKNSLDNNFTEAIVPFAKISFTNLREWKDLIVLVQDKIQDSEDVVSCKELLNEILNHLAETTSPTQLNAILEATMPKTDDLHVKYLMKSQQNSYANDIKEIIVNTGHQLLHSNSVH